MKKKNLINLVLKDLWTKVKTVQATLYTLLAKTKVKTKVKRNWDGIEALWKSETVQQNEELIKYLESQQV